MPHDAKGRVLEPGDLVTVKAVVKEVYPGEEACNVQVELVGGPEGQYAPVVTCNSGFFVKASEELAERAFARDLAGGEQGAPEAAEA